MKKFIYIFLIFFSFLDISSAYAVENYTPGQDLGNPDGSITIPNAATGDTGKNKVSKEIGNVTQQGMGTLDKLMEAIQSNLEQSLKSSLQNYYQKITAPLIYVFSGFILIWMTFQGFKMMLGMAVDFQSVVSNFIIMMIIWSIVFSWDAFYPYIAEVFLEDIPNLISEMTGHDTQSTFTTFVTIVFDVVTESFKNVDMGITNVVSGFFFVLVYLVLLLEAVILCVIFFLIWTLCKMVIAILVVVAPIFIAAAMFPATRKYATNWLQAVLTPNAIILLTIVTCDLFLSGVITAYDNVVGENGGSNFVVAFVLMITIGLVIGMFYLIPRIAISLVGSGFEASSSGTQGVMGGGKSGMKKLFSK
ncbi:type IV secretion system protein [Acinetobacter baumannii]|uniref:type IV secretion system protein n=1 Tax=Acinetobacter baumannii TaxID=470 RepID=UPI0027CC156C|nr:type IV secretion system protein [Acinetobacter baumannii]MDQ2406310.1 type IV secretion system protein [Acinetobacter baumannii]MDQ2438278.1 type IV secretion system protein [Acinetobacter baumannii]MDQ2458220.1 type IV secretion system protein [Acinetobacter baumannii]